MTHPDQIGPYESSARVWEEYVLAFYILLLLAVEFHGTIGLYRLSVKWGWFDGENPRETRKKLLKIKMGINCVLLSFRICFFAAYMKIGYEKL